MIKSNEDAIVVLGEAMGYLALAESEFDTAYNKIEDVLDWLRGGKPPFEDISAKLLQHPEKRYNLRSLDSIKQIVIHHVGIDAPVTPAATASYHVRTRGWPGIAYHFFIRMDGTAYQTQPLNVVSYHCGGQCNVISIGICLEGSFMEREPSQKQLGATKEVIDWLLDDFDLKVLGHKEVEGTSTACPGNTWDDWKEKIMP